MITDWFNDRRKAKFKSPQVEALAKASATGARGIRATTPPPKKDPGGWMKHDAEMERNAVHSKARDYSDQVGDRGARYQLAAQMVEMNLKQGKDGYGHRKV